LDEKGNAAALYYEGKTYKRGSHIVRYATGHFGYDWPDEIPASVRSKAEALMQDNFRRAHTRYTIAGPKFVPPDQSGSRAMIYGPNRTRNTIAGRRYKPFTRDEILELAGNALPLDVDEEDLAQVIEHINDYNQGHSRLGLTGWINDTLGFFGIERTHGVNYLNAGDMYSATLVDDGDQIYITDIGSIIEDRENLTHDPDEWLECEVCGVTDDDEEFAERTLCRGCYVERYGVLR
jgi:hypothetical protein